MVLDPAALAQEIRQVAGRAVTEEDLRIGVEHALAGIRRDLNILPRYERTYSGAVSVFGGRSADAVYGHAVIEYKRPGRLSRKRDVHEAVNELKKYLYGEANRHGGDLSKSLRRMIGIGLDGQQIFFLRYRGARRISSSMQVLFPGAQLPLFAEDELPTEFHRVGPLPITPQTVEQFLLYLRALRRRPLTPESLAEEFGPKGGIAEQMVATLYSRLSQALTHDDAAETRTDTFFSEWDRIFGIVYGEDLDKAQKDVTVLAKLYGLSGTEDLKRLLFAVHSYYALLMKLLAAELASLQAGSLVSSIASELAVLPEEELLIRLRDLENGGLFARLGIQNFLEGDFFGWYLSCWDSELDQSVRMLAKTLADYEPATGTLQPEATRDLLKKLYQYLVPREIRHDLGEYYTPDWLAEVVLDDLGYQGQSDQRLLDPACGSGTFLVLAIRRCYEYAEEMLLQPKKVIEAVLSNVVGFDLNPLAVIAARTNYLLALGNLVRHKSPIELPVYLCDSILTPAQQPKQSRLEHRLAVPVPSVVGSFWVPREVVESRQMGTRGSILEECVESAASEDAFLRRCQRELRLTEELSEATLIALYRKFSELERTGRDGIWARIVKNAFAPVFAGKFDYVAGNPPWVNWESLADEYREATRELWGHYGLFSLEGHAARLGGGKKDVAMLMLYAAMDHYVKPGGKRGFVLTQTLFKSRRAGEGFRRFQLGLQGEKFKVGEVHDLVSLNPFEGATNRTSVAVFTKGEETSYPVKYTLWQKASSGRFPTDATLPDVRRRTKQLELSAQPVDAGDPTSPWLTLTAAALPAIRKVLGSSPYRAYAGSYTGGLNGVYWIRVIEARPDDLLVIENLYDEGRTKVEQVRTLVEPNFVYPLLRGRDVGRWWARPSAHILLVQDPKKRIGYPEEHMISTAPNTYKYLQMFEEELLTKRKSGVIQDLMKKGPFYSMYAVSDYTMSQHKVVWREQATDFTVAVSSTEAKPVIPDHKLMMVPCENSQEAYYLSAVMNSTIVRLAVRSYVVEVSTSTHVLEVIGIPKYDSSNERHLALADRSRKIHSEVQKKREILQKPEISSLEEEIDVRAAELWQISDCELDELRKCDAAMNGSTEAADSIKLGPLEAEVQRL